VAQAITACIRQDVDSGYRYGGDEFAVILPYSDEVRAAGVAERIRRTYEDFSFPDTGLSIGLTEMSPDDDIDDLVNRADSAMYVAKHAGGNKVHIESAARAEDADGGNEGEGEAGPTDPAGRKGDNSGP
jgi:diguanylate cyclase (GGDEF)-like protein